MRHRKFDNVESKNDKIEETVDVLRTLFQSHSAVGKGLISSCGSGHRNRDKGFTQWLTTRASVDTESLRLTFLVSYLAANGSAHYLTEVCDCVRGCVLAHVCALVCWHVA